MTRIKARYVNVMVRGNRKYTTWSSTAPHVTAIVFTETPLPDAETSILLTWSPGVMRAVMRALRHMVDALTNP